MGDDIEQNTGAILRYYMLYDPQDDKWLTTVDGIEYEWVSLTNANMGQLFMLATFEKEEDIIDLFKSVLTKSDDEILWVVPVDVFFWGNYKSGIKDMVPRFNISGILNVPK